MVRMDASGERFSKARIYRALAERFGRSSKAFEYRMQNISALYHQMGLEWARGLKPADHIGAEMSARLSRIIGNSPTYVVEVEERPEPTGMLVEEGRSEMFTPTNVHDALGAAALDVHDSDHFVFRTTCPIFCIALGAKRFCIGWPAGFTYQSLPSTCRGFDDCGHIERAPRSTGELALNLYLGTIGLTAPLFHRARKSRATRGS